MPLLPQLNQGEIRWFSFISRVIGIFNVMLGFNITSYTTQRKDINSTNTLSP